MGRGKKLTEGRKDDRCAWTRDETERGKREEGRGKREEGRRK
jgi:hypothetical protein